MTNDKRRKREIKTIRVEILRKIFVNQCEIVSNENGKLEPTPEYRKVQKRKCDAVRQRNETGIGNSRVYRADGS